MAGFVLLEEKPLAPTLIAGLTVRDRLVRSFEKLGIPLIEPSALENLLKENQDTSVIVARTDRVVDLDILREIANSEAQGLAFIDQKAPSDPIGVAAVPCEIAQKNIQVKDATVCVDWPGLARHLKPRDVLELKHYEPGMRKIVEPRWFDVATSDRREIEDHLLNASNKGANDWVAQVLHPTPQNFTTRLLWRFPWITPNLVTVLAVLGSLLAVFGFAVGAFFWATVWGNLQGIWDGVDGKLARTTLRFSKFGDYLDHVSDQIYEPLWYLAMGWALRSELSWPTNGLFLSGILVFSYFLDRIISGWFRSRNLVEIHDYRRVDRFVRVYGARRNNIMLILLFGVLLGEFPHAFLCVTAYMALTALARAYRFLWIELRNLSPDVPSA